MCRLRSSVVVALLAACSAVPTAWAQRKPDAPVQKPPPPLPENVADQPFRDAYRALGYVRMAVVVNVHAADVAVEGRTKTTTTVERLDGSKEKTTEHGKVLLAIPKEDQTNAWRINRALGSRLMDCFRHRDIRMTLVSLDDMGEHQAFEIRSLVMRNEQEAARMIGKQTGADLVLVLTMTRAVEADASGARYGANYFLADTKRNEIIDSWSWDMKADRDNAYPAPVLGTYARHAAVRIHDKFLVYAGQASAPGGGTLKFHTLHFVGLPGEKMAKLSEALGKVEKLRVIRTELETKGDSPVASLEVESSIETDKLAEQVRVAAADALGVKVSIRKIREGDIELGVTMP